MLANFILFMSLYFIVKMSGNWFMEQLRLWLMENLRGLIIMNNSFSKTICGICMEDKQRLDQMFINKGNPCSHPFCIKCISRHVKAKVERKATVITCPEPDCKAVLEPDICQGIIAKEVLEAWSTALFESLCSGSNMVNCPFEDCFEKFVEEGGLLVTETECAYCHRLFCAQCMVPWHFDMRCEDFRRMMMQDNDRRQRRQALDDQRFLNLVHEKQWRRCPNCKFYVQKVDGCLHVTCRCKFEFCYGCGSNWSQTHICPQRGGA